MKQLMTSALVTALMMGGVQSAFAQDAPRCGGLLCDLGILGRGPAPGPAGAPAAPDPTALPCNDFLCRAFGGHTAEAAPPPPPPEAAPEPAPAPLKHKAKKKRMAKAAEATTPAAPSDAK